MKNYILEETQMKTASELKEELFYSKKSVYELKDEEHIKKAFDYAEGYKKYLDVSKTEREAVISSIAIAEKAGFRPYRFGDELKKGDKLYYNNRGKSLFLFTIGSESIENGVRISAAHIDSPRLDFKPCPVFEESRMGFFKTHYYGGIKKYQWPTIPLAIHGVVTLKDGSHVNVTIGEDDVDPIFYINDILPHLGALQAKKPLGEAIEGEMLNLFAGSRPYSNDDEGEQIKLNILAILNEKYGITEADFMAAELCAVPAEKAKDAGLDRAAVAAYGHDDSVCAYPALTSVIDNADSVHTLMCVLADKEEIGSEGVSGMQCEVFEDLLNAISKALGGDPAVVREHSMCLSADVAAAYDPNFKEVFEKRNTPEISCGTVLIKYTGARGKSATSDASAEFVGLVRAAMEKDEVVWQTGELGKIDIGGGGTVAKYIAKMNIDTVDLGVPVISMHAPYELITKVDLYETYRAFSAFCKY